MPLKEYLGYLLAALILLFHVFSADLSQRLDWVNFGSEYRGSQQGIFNVLQQQEKNAQALDSRLKVLEEKKGKE